MGKILNLDRVILLRWRGLERYKETVRIGGWLNGPDFVVNTKMGGQLLWKKVTEETPEGGSREYKEQRTKGRGLNPSS